MKISIITATYNRANTIRDTIKSILSQTYQDWEHIIVDGASSDNTLEVIDEYKDRYCERLKLISERDKGIYDAMNKGISIASGDVIGFLNSDDLYYNQNTLQYIANTFRETSCESVFGGIVIAESGNLNKTIRIKKGSSYPKKGFRSGWHPAHPSFYAKKEVFKKYGIYDISFGTAADMEIMIRFLEKYKISSSYIPQILVKMRFGGASNSSVKNLLKSNSQVLRAFEKNGLSRPHFYILKKLTPKVISLIKTKFGIERLESEK